MSPSLPRRSILRTGGVGLFSAIAGCSVFSTEESSSPIPIFLENRGEEQYTTVVIVDGTVEEEAFTKEISISSKEIVKVGEVDSDSFCLLARVPSISDMDEVCPGEGDEDYSLNGHTVIIHPATATNPENRRVEIAKIEDADVQ